MASTALATIEDLGELPPPPPARPRVLLVSTVLGTASAVMFFAGLLGIYLHERAAVLAEGERWLPEGVDIPLTPANMSLIGFVLGCVTMQWAVDAIGHDDRRHTWMAFGATLVVGAFHLVGTGFLYSQVGMAVSSTQGALFYAVTGAHLAMVGVAMVFAALMAFRTLGGRYSAKDREGVVAAALFWYATSAVYGAIWYAVLVTK
jgi:heme/copper-type cytochrome/quinol oxidase subunit 3